MPSYVSQYRGQSSFLPSGYLEAAQQSGKNIAAGIASAGESIGKGLGAMIERYNKNKEDDASVSQVLETTAPSVVDWIVRENAQDGDEEAQAMVASATKFAEGKMNLAQKKAFAADLMLYRDRKEKEQIRNEEAQRFWYGQNAAKEDRDRRWEAEEDHRAWQKEQALWAAARQNGLDLAAAEDRKFAAEDRKRAAEQRASDEAAAAAVLNYVPGGTVEGTEDVLVPNPAIQEYRNREKEIQAEVDAAQAAVDKFSQAPASIPSASVNPESRRGESDPEFYRETLARALDTLSEQVGSSALNKLPAKYGLGSDVTYNERDPRNIPSRFIDKVPTGKKFRGQETFNKVVNIPRVGAWIQELRGQGVDIDNPQFRALEYLSNKRSRTPEDAAPETLGSQRMSAAHLNALGLLRDAQFRQQQLGEAPPEQITETRPTSRAMTNEETEARIRQHIEATMPNASSTAKLAAMRQLMSQDAPEIQTIKDEAGNEYVRLPQGFQANKPVMSVADQLALVNEQRKQRALQVPGFTGQAPSEQEAKEFRVATTSIDKAVEGIDELISMIDIPGKSFSREERARAQTLQNLLVGALRLEIVGPGAVSDGERKMLQDSIRNPTDFFSLDRSNSEALNTLKRVLLRGQTIAAANLGLTPAEGQAPSGEQGEEAFTKRASNGVQFNRR